MTGTLLHVCEGGCGRALQLLIGTVRGRLCPDCYRRLGQPVAAAVGAEDAERIRQETAARMLKRGGTDRHLVRSGKAGL